MARKKTSTPKIDASQAFRDFGAQFRNLDPRDPSLWPVVPRFVLLLFLAAAVVVILWFIWLKNFSDELEVERTKEATLRTEFQTKVQRAVSLEELKKQRVQVQQYVTLLEKQLPSQAEMAALLSDINQAGLGRSLQFDVFRPGQLVVKDYYAELPIALKVTGRYHDIGAFTSDIAHLSRIVTLSNISVAPSTDKERTGTGALTLEATAKTYRYLDQNEIDAQREARAKEKEKARKK